MKPEYTFEDHVRAVAECMWGEARGEGAIGMIAVGNVIMNRVKAKSWWGRSPAAVCRHAFQFSCFNRNDPNSAKLPKLTAADKHFDQALKLAARAVGGQLTDVTGGATHYHAVGIKPAWTKGATLTKQIGNHLFYRDVP